jgi:uncharacterized protein with PQ loop repeat
MLEVILQVVAVVSTAIAWVPQARKILKSTDRSGVSVLSWTLGGLTGLLFALYGVRSHVWSLVLSEGAFTIGALLIVAALIGIKKTLGLVGLSVFIFVAAFFLSPFEVGMLGVFGSLGMRVLQIYSTVTTKSVAGMSRGSWMLLSTNCAAWGVYGALSAHWPLVLTSVAVLLSSVVLLVLSKRVGLEQSS